MRGTICKYASNVLFMALNDYAIATGDDAAFHIEHADKLLQSVARRFTGRSAHEHAELANRMRTDGNYRAMVFEELCKRNGISTAMPNTVHGIIMACQTMIKCLAELEVKP